MSKNMKHYIAVSLDINYNNIIIIGFNTEKKADNAIEKLKFYEDSYHSCKLFSIGYYGYCEEQKVRSYHKNNNIIQFINRKTPLNDSMIRNMANVLLMAYIETLKHLNKEEL